MSVPKATLAYPFATAAALPPDEPPGIWVSVASHGFVTLPKYWFWVVMPSICMFGLCWLGVCVCVCVCVYAEIYVQRLFSFWFVFVSLVSFMCKLSHGQKEKLTNKEISSVILGFVFFKEFCFFLFVSNLYSSPQFYACFVAYQPTVVTTKKIQQKQLFFFCFIFTFGNWKNKKHKNSTKTHKKIF